MRLFLVYPVIWLCFQPLLQFYWCYRLLRVVVSYFIMKKCFTKILKFQFYFFLLRYLVQTCVWHLFIHGQVAFWVSNCVNLMISIWTWCSYQASTCWKCNLTPRFMCLISNAYQEWTRRSQTRAENSNKIIEKQLLNTCGKWWQREIFRDDVVHLLRHLFFN